MPGLSGLEVARVASAKCHVVFVTAYDDYAVAAFDQGAVDYVMRPVTAARPPFIETFAETSGSGSGRGRKRCR